VEYSSNSIVRKKAIAFAIRIVHLAQYLESKREYVISKQVLRSGTSIGANVHEGVYAQSKPDFIHKMSIALKEASETEYWLLLLKEGKYVEKQSYESINADCIELLKLITAIVKTAKANLT
jgi:four helix bundle protein